ncbi:MAG: 3-oxoacyl-[acyl-carrier-protein] synthase III [Chlamydiales bacterium]|jgi:3-oxoacyl-[acyl-carrier-protein] synthase III
MRYESVHLEAFGHALPEEVVSSEALEHRTDALYERLGLSVGRLELMSGIRTRRFWPPGTRPSAVAAAAGRDALERSGVDLGQIGCLIHASVCRDFMEPATASVVHAELGLPPTCQAFDLSNACLGFANAMTVVADKIERGEIQAGLVVAGEDGRGLVDETVRMLNTDPQIGRKEMKAAYASLTIGSGAAALVLTSASISRVDRRLLGGTLRAATEHVELCSGGTHKPGAGPLMDTDSEALLLAGNALARTTWEAFTEEFDWDADSIDRIVTHQVGSAHKRLLFETLGLDHAKDFTTVEEYGNIGSVSLPLTFSLAERAGFIQDGHKVVLQGIGSGLHCLMLAVQC